MQKFSDDLSNRQRFVEQVFIKMDEFSYNVNIRSGSSIEVLIWSTNIFSNPATNHSLLCLHVVVVISMLNNCHCVKKCRLKCYPKTCFIKINIFVRLSFTKIFKISWCSWTNWTSKTTKAPESFFFCSLFLFKEWKLF